MANPFRYGGVVGRESFCNRKRELEDLVRAAENGDRVFLYGERRFGKTSLALRMLHNLDAKKYIGAYVDLWPTESEESFAAAMAGSISGGLASSADRLLETAKRFFGGLAPSVSLDPQGAPQLSFGVRGSSIKASGLRDVLAAPEEIARRRKKRVVVVFDEFQRVLEYGGDMVERTLRSVIQEHTHVAYFFLGSRKHMIQRMFLDQSRPLFRSGGHYPLGPISEEHWIPFVRNRFKRSDKGIGAEQIRIICGLTGGHPFYTQHLCHAVWELCEPGGRVDRSLIDKAFDLLLDRESYAYTALWESFAQNQRRFTTGLATEPPGVRPFSADFIGRYRLRSASNAQRAAEGLLERDIIDRENGSFTIIDRFFRAWIRRMGGVE
ncbi:MAG: ATP-binding protein [Candidatus Eisenbacteria bacterium]|nr:ATP-binding protein [Candidatus Eisenbacteria bacterium]